MNNESKQENLPLGLYWKDKRTTVDHVVLPFQSLEIIETINESRATRVREKDTIFRSDPSKADTS
jgi:site-specific DNA-methyltransferase (adenine-specific)/adenine-specific DNA-methyltransferase